MLSVKARKNGEVAYGGDNMAKTAAGKKKVFVKATNKTKAHYRSTPNKKGN